MSMNNIPQSTTLSNATAGTSCFDANHIDVTTIEDLEQVGSDKWTRYPGCIGAFIAEMDYGLAPCVAEAIEEATERRPLVRRMAAPLRLGGGSNVHPPGAGRAGGVRSVPARDRARR